MRRVFMGTEEDIVGGQKTGSSGLAFPPPRPCIYVFEAFGEDQVQIWLLDQQPIDNRPNIVIRYAPRAWHCGVGLGL